MRKPSLLSITYGNLLLILLFLVSATAHAQTPPLVEVDVLGTCLPASSSGGTPASTKFFVQYSQTPDSVYWLFGQDATTGDSLSSRQLQPIHTFSEPNTYPVQLFAVYGSDTSEYVFTIDIRQSEDELQIKDQGEDKPISQEVVFCPGETKTLEATVSSGGQEGTATPVNWFKPQSADQPQEIGATSITIGTDKNADGKYKDVGTYYVVHDDGNGCILYQTFRVVIFNEEDQNASIWYFGEEAGIDFRNGAQPIQSTALVGGNSAPEGNAIIGDANADILFHTNGESLWFGNDEQDAPNDDPTLGGSRNVTQNSLFVPFAADESLFYLFTINDAGLLSFSALDLKTNPIPGVALSQAGDNAGDPLRTIPLHESVAEKITSTGRSDGGVWVVTHEMDTDAFLSYPVSAEGIGSAVRSEAGAVHSDGTGYMRFSGGGDFLATTVNAGGSKFIELFRFDADSGTVSDPIQLPIDETGILYGLEFSDTRLYATVRNPSGPSYFYQFTVDSTYNEATILESKVMIEVDSEDLGALQVGPDGQLYIARNGSGFLYTYSTPTDSIDDPDNFSFVEFDLAGGTSTLGLPNFGANAGMQVPEADVSVAAPACFGDDIEVSGTQRYSNDERIIFEFYKDSPNSTVIHTATQELQQQQTPGGGQSDPPNLPFSAYEAHGPGTYFVRLTIQNPCGIYPDPSLGQEEVIQEFTINPKPEAAIEGERFKELCGGNEVTFNGQALLEGQPADPNEVTFVWLDAVSNAFYSSDSAITVSEPGAWLFFAISSNGCPSDTINVEARELLPEIESEDFGTCVGGTLPRQELNVAVQNAADYNFNWLLSINGGTPEQRNANSTTQDLTDVDLDRVGTYAYILEVTPANSALDCYTADTVLVTISAPPMVEIVASENNCDGTAVLTAEVEGGSDELSYNWAGPGITSGQGTPQINVEPQSQGEQEYTLTVIDGNSGCEETATLTINLRNPLADFQLEEERSCGDEGYTLRVQTSYSGDDLSIQWFEGNAELTALENQREIDVPSGTYRAVVSIANSQCEQSTAEETITLAPIGNEEVLLQSVYVLCPIFEEMKSQTLVVPGFQKYRWTNVTTGQVVSRDSAYVITEAGNYELQVNDCEPVPFQVVHDCTPKLILPNAIRVGGTNNSFFILNENMRNHIEDFQILIMNRWGQVIWQSNDPAFNWQGTTQSGETVMTNTYVYVITYRNPYSDEQQLLKQRGGITVLR